MLTRTELGCVCVSAALLASLAMPALGQERERALHEASPSSGLIVRSEGAGTILSLVGDVPFHVTTDSVMDARLVEVPGSPVRLAIWTEVQPDGEEAPFYAISLDGRSVNTVRRTSYMLKLRHGDFDPGAIVARPSAVHPSLAADENTTLYIVQFVTQPLDAFRTAVENAGGSVHHYLANHARIVEMSEDVRDRVARLPFVRWIEPYHPAYRLEEVLLAEFEQNGLPLEKRRYHVQVVRSGWDQKHVVADRIRAIGGTVDLLAPTGFLLDATLTPQQLLTVVRMNEVLFIDRWLPPQLYMNNVREDGGANHVESVGGYTGEGVRGEVMDSGLLTTHQGFQLNPPIIHECNSGDTWHGTSVFGIVFGDGTGDADGRGLIPDAQGIFAAWDCGTDRYDHTMELVQAPYNAVFQTNSWGFCCTTEYGTEAAEMDRMIFDSDLVILQAQANEGSRDSDVSVWAKNVVSIGGIRHYNTLTRSDDQWSYAGSIGPAADGRVKPDLSYWYDSILTTSDSGAYTTSFGGTSAATPETAGHFGLFFQMWADGIFGNEVDPLGTVFDNRSHAATAKAVLVNTAMQYPFVGGTHDLTRVHQGWGTADVGRLYDIRDKISVIDETTVLANLETATYYAYVESGEPALRATMVYTDPPGTTSSSQHRINDLTLKLTSPSDIVYWGNNGLLNGIWSTAGGAPNTIDTVENVFVQDPEAGMWTVEVIAGEVNDDSHAETPETDADFALVVSGALLSSCSAQGRIDLGTTKCACEDQLTIGVVDCDLNIDNEAVETATVVIGSDTEAGGETVLLTETGQSTADFQGTIDVSTVDVPGVLHVTENDIVTATYVDADDGQGGMNVVVTDTAVVDCTLPQISNVQSTNIQPWNAMVTFDTDEPARGSVRYGLGCGGLTETAMGAVSQTEHAVNLTGLEEATTYFYAVDAEDDAGNMSTDDNGGSCHALSTPHIPDYFTEGFSGEFDLQNKTVVFIPNGSISYYGGCSEGAAEFPTDPTGGTTLSLSDDGFSQVSIGGGETVALYGTSHDSFFVNSNGNITFTSGDSTWQWSLSEHFNQARISGLFADLNPSSAGTISWRQLDDRMAVTWEHVPEYGTSDDNNFQVEMFFNGRIQITWLSVDTTSGIAGVSAGDGQPSYFVESDLGAQGACYCLNIAPGEGLSSSGFEGGPFTPECMTHTLTNYCDTSQDWTAAGTQAWLDVTPGMGTLAASGSIPVDVCLNTNASTLTPNSYDDIVTFADTTSGNLQTLQVALEVMDVLAVTPPEDSTSSGEEGGPFEPVCATYTLTNHGSASLDWSASGTAEWLDVDPPGGILAASDFVSVDVCINANANSLAVDVFTDTVTFTNDTTGQAQIRGVALTVLEPCLPPSVPTGPFPGDGATGVPTVTTLVWDEHVGEEHCPTTYDVYLDTDDPPATLICEDVSGAGCSPDSLDYEMVYFWKVVARTPAGETPGPVWSFTTAYAPCDPPAEESLPYRKIRSISFVPMNPERETALRVTLTNLPPPFQSLENLHMWVGQTRMICENSGQAVQPPEGCGPAPGLPSNEFAAANLQCAPHCMDYGAVGLLHVTDDEIVPDAEYTVQAIDCRADFDNESNYSDPLTIGTSIWGDLIWTCEAPSCGPPDGTVNVTTDVTAILDKYKNLEGAVVKARTDIEPNRPDWVINITDVMQCLDAFLGFTYPPDGWTGPGGCP